MRRKGRHIIVIGMSEGELDTLDELIGQLPTDLAASMFIVQPLTPDSPGGTGGPV